LVSQNSNLFYLPAGKVIAAGTNRNLMQAGVLTAMTEDNVQISKRELIEQIDYLKYQVDKLMKIQESRQAVVEEEVKVDPEEQRNMKMAALLASR
jgi:2-keto-4-pentenoate hydratase/2-oxohepta-3-ene-1,7-dioic acid hydratase in catechol pathway